jgi:glycerol kinase
VADQLQIPVTRPVVTETTALGAAYAAGLGVGTWGSIDDVRDAWHEDLTVEPTATPEAADAAYATWKRAVERSLGWEPVTPG